MFSKKAIVAQETMLGKNKKPNLLSFPVFLGLPWYFVRQAVGDDLFIEVAFIRNIRLSSFLGLSRKNKRGTLLLTHSDTDSKE